MKANALKSGIIILFLTVFLSGCGAGIPNQGRLEIFTTPIIEDGWIRNGEPLEYEGEFWYPKDSVDNLLDSEVLLIGDYRGVQFFVERTDVKPFKRLFTKFGRNQFRAFDKQQGK